RKHLPSGGSACLQAKTPAGSILSDRGFRLQAEAPAASQDGIRVLTPIQQLIDRISGRSDEGIRPWMFDQSGAYGIRHDVPHGHDQFLVVPNHAVVAISLPEAPTIFLPVREPRILFRRFDERTGIRTVVFPLYHEMYVIGHEAVRDIRETLLTRG